MTPMAKNEARLLANNTRDKPRLDPKPDNELDDNLLDSLGKAITDPMTSAAEPEEPGANGLPSQLPGG